uniref:Cytochrome b n=1 Tax=Eucoleus annulatus TaxID=2831232 RepID=A0A8E8LRL0_9BILA|nr:cytochrome b [Eucoleus annulatus]QWC93302.1 cytochrome b [Eucoleus annulatus]
MKKSYLKSINMISQVIDLPTPWNISYLWNLGSFLGMMMTVQVLSGLVLVFYYIPSEIEAFDSVIFIMRESKFGFLFRFIHLNGASFVFMLMYSHMLKGLLNNSYNLTYSWLSGNMIFLLTILVAFMGYVLPWGNMGFWAATVITSFISAIPIIGKYIMNWIWGSFSVSGHTLQFFFTLHYLLPFLIMGLAVIHLLLLHYSGSSNPLGTFSSSMKIKFYPFFTSKDLMNMVVFLFMLLWLMLYPYWSSDPENFSYADRLISPINIQPEWYFLPFYALLRSSSNKLGGLILMVLGIFMFWILPSFNLQDLKNFNIYHLLLLIFFCSGILLGWVASWSADSYVASWLVLLTLIYFGWWYTVWMMSLMLYSIYE